MFTIIRAFYLTFVVALAVVLLETLYPARADAQDVKKYTLDTFIQWVNKNSAAKPDFKPGDVLTVKDLPRLQPFVAPGFFESLNFSNFHAQVGDTEDHTPRTDYVDCTEQHQNQVGLTADGALSNYVCGQPFLNDTLKSSDPNSGIKAAWNYEYRWQYYGLACVDIGWHWVQFDGKGNHNTPPPITPPASFLTMTGYASQLPTSISDLYDGGGTFQRNLQSNYRRTYYSHLAQEPTHALPISNSKDFEFKEITAFFDPFDIRGTAFIIYRYSDPHRADDAWAYLPVLRRVRRISAEVKSDSLLGTDFTLDDFYSFAGREQDWEFKFLGWKDVLVVANRKHTYTHFFGPTTMTPDDVWELRRAAVVLRTPKDPRHPYSSSLMLWDSQNYDPIISFAFDRNGKLWKYYLWQYKWSEDYKKEWAEINHGVRSITFPTADVTDVQNNRGTLVDGFGCGFPRVDAAQVESLYDISKLEQSHR